MLTNDKFRYLVVNFKIMKNWDQGNNIVEKKLGYLTSTLSFSSSSDDWRMYYYSINIYTI